jgi:hypothetical protein
VPEMDLDLAMWSKGKSRRARQIRKQMELIELCQNASKTTMEIYLPKLEIIHDQKT